MGNGWVMETNLFPFRIKSGRPIDAALEQHPSTFEDFLKILEASGVEVTRRGKSINFRVSGQKKPTRCNTLKGGYTEQAIRERIAGTYISSGFSPNGPILR